LETVAAVCLTSQMSFLPTNQQYLMNEETAL